MIKKFYFALALGAVTSLIACDSKNSSNTEGQDGEKTEQAEKSDDSEVKEETPVIEQNEEQVLSELREMYRNTETWNYDMLTPEFRADIEAANKKAKEIGDEMGCFDYDIFTCSQDPGKCGVVENVKLNNDGTATANVVGRFGSEGYIIVTVKLIDGSYYIDDIADVNMGSVRTQAQNYCK